MKHNLCRILLSFAGVFFFATADAHFKTTPQSPVHITETGELVYKPYPNGDRVPDFSFCGYRRSEYPIPWVDAKVYVPVVDGDATDVIQQALDYVASLPVGPDGFRGAVQLAPGNYELKGKLLMRTGGVVLRGSGCHKEGGTVLRASGPMKDELIRVFGYDNAKTGDTVQIADRYVPVNATVIPLKQTATLKAGDRIRLSVRLLPDGFRRWVRTDWAMNRNIISRNGLPEVMTWCGSVPWSLQLPTALR